MRRIASAPLTLTAGVALLGGLVLGGGTFALWNHNSDGVPLPLTSGNLSISHHHEPTWQVLPDGSESALHAVDPTQYLFRPGDIAVAEHPFTVELSGTNTQAVLSVAWDLPPQLPEGVTGTYMLVDDAQKPLTDPLLVGETAELYTFTAHDDAAEHQLSVSVRLDLTGMVEPDAPEQLDHPQVLGEFAVRLDQRRDGSEN